MSSEIIALHEPQFSEKDIRLVSETLQSAWVSTGGPFVDKFETSFAKFVGRRFAVSLCSGTVALQMAIEVLKDKYAIKTGFDVILPNLTFIATSNAVIHARGIPVLADVMKNSLNIDLNSVKRIIAEKYSRNGSGEWHNLTNGNRLLAIIPVHVMGWLGNVKELHDYANSVDIDIIEDAAESLGTKYMDGTHSGNSGVMSCYSFNGNKILTTGGGGMITTNDENFARRAKHLSTTAKIDGLRFVHDEVGYNFRLVNILAALGFSQLEDLNQRLLLKKNINHFYESSLNGSSSICLYREESSISNNWINNLIFDDRELKEETMSVLIGKNIQVRPIWTPINMQPAYSFLDESNVDLSNSIDIWSRTLSLPSSSHLNEETLSRIVHIIKSVVD